MKPYRSENDCYSYQP